MKTLNRKLRVLRVATLLIAVVVWCGDIAAQKTNIGFVYPSGGERGSTTTISVGGQSIATATKVLISGEGVTAEIIPPSADAPVQQKRKGRISDEDNLQIAQTLKIKVSIAKDAPLGIRDFRVVNNKGEVSNRLYFEVGEYPDYIEKEMNNSLDSANYVAKLPATLNGYVEKSMVKGTTESGGGGIFAERGGQDFYSFDLKAGETFVAEVKAERFVPFLADAVPGWFQATVTLFDSKGNEVAYNDDHNLHPDPVLFYNIPKSGRYTLKICDAIYRGREDFVYRINVGAIPYVTSIYPLGGELGKETTVEVRGVNLGGKKSTTLKIKPSKSGKISTTYRATSGYSSNEFYFESQEGRQEVTRSKDEQPLSGEIVINGQMLSAGEEHWYAVDISEKGNWAFDLMGRRLGSPIDAKMGLYDSSRKLIKEVDDIEDNREGMMTHHADPKLTHKFTSTGRYYIRVKETQNKFGEEYSYRLSIESVKPDFSLRISPATISIPQGGSSTVTIFATRESDFKGMIDLKIDGLPSGYKVSQNTKMFGGMKRLQLFITAPKDATVGQLDIKVIGESKLQNGTTITRVAEPAEEMMQAFYITHLLPTSAFRADITPTEPFTITLESVDGKDIVLEQGKVVPIRVRLHRQEGFNEPVVIMKKIPVWGTTFNAITIEGDQSEGIINIECNKLNKQFRSGYMMVMGTVNGSTNNRVAGQTRTTVNAAIMVNSDFIMAKGILFGKPFAKQSNQNKRIEK